MAGQCVRVVDGPLSGIVFAEKRQEPYMGFDIGVLSWIYVDPAARGQGTSHRLMKAAHAWMDEQGVQGRMVYVTAANAAAVKLYQRHGYRVADYRNVGSGGLMDIFNLEHLCDGLVLEAVAVPVGLEQNADLCKRPGGSLVDADELPQLFLLCLIKMDIVLHALA